MSPGRDATTGAAAAPAGPRGRVRAWAAEFFFTDEPVTGVVVYRVFLAVWTIAFYLPRLPHVGELYAREVLRDPTRMYRWIGAPLPTEAWLTFVVGLLLVLLVLLAAGVRPRLLNVLVVLILSYINLLDTITQRAYGSLMLTQWWLLMLAPHIRLRDGAGEIRTAPRWAQRLLMLQLCAVYLFAVVAKASAGASWFNGEAVYNAVGSPRFGRHLLSEWFQLGPALCTAIGLGTLAGELFVAIGLWFRRTRVLAMLTLVGLHVGMALTLRVSLLFHVLMVGHLILFVDPRAWTRWIPPRRSA